jgi:hypothetical protein
MSLINTYQDYLKALKDSPTEMFWVVPNDVIVDPNFKFDIYFSHDNEYDRKMNHVFLNDEYYDGLMLMSKHRPVSEREFNNRFLLERKEWDLVVSKPKPYDIFYINEYEEYLDAVEKSSTEMFWVVPNDVIVDPNFKFDIYFSHHNRYDRTINHIFLNGEVYDGVMLLSKNKIISKREFDSRFLIEKKEWDVLASTPKKYEIFEISTYEDYLNAAEKSSTNMFWAVWNDVILNEGFTFDYQVPRYNQQLVYIFKNGNYFDGVCLMPKNKIYSKNEVKFRFFIDKKEVDLKISNPKKYDIFEIDNYEEYQYALDNSSTDLFWMTSKNIKPDDDFKFDLYFSHHQEYERNENHAFLHKFNNELSYNGVFLLSKFNVVSAKEINYRFLINRKEWDIVASGPRLYDVFNIDTYEEYLEALKKSITEMFWVVPNDVIVDPNFKFDIYFSHDNEYDRKMNHVFLNDEYYDGIRLLSKHRVISKREFNSRFLLECKQWDTVISKPKPFDKFYIDTYQDYLDSIEQATTEMIWLIPKEVEPREAFDFTFYIPYYDKANRQMHHAFKNLLTEDVNYNGIQLVSKKTLITEKEIIYRSIINKQNHEIEASNHKPYDIIFISYNEPNADENFKDLQKRFPKAKRVHGVKGIHQAHIRAATVADTKMFWVVDGDAKILDDFNFDYEVPVWNHNTVHVWRSRNPINDLEYGYGGAKLLPRQLTLNMDVTSTDMTTSISDSFKIMDTASNITAFNTDAFSTWKSAFRECAKLASKSVKSQIDEETEQRLNVWCTQGADKLFGDVAIAGALAGKLFAETQPTEIHKINDFDWLYRIFESNL